jgi:hypothetical protein
MVELNLFQSSRPSSAARSPAKVGDCKLRQHMFGSESTTVSATPG